MYDLINQRQAYGYGPEVKLRLPHRRQPLFIIRRIHPDHGPVYYAAAGEGLTGGWTPHAEAASAYPWITAAHTALFDIGMPCELVEVGIWVPEHGHVEKVEVSST